MKMPPSMRALMAFIFTSVVVLVCGTAAADPGCASGEKCAADISDDAILRVVLGDELNAHVKELGSLSNSDSMNTRHFLTPAWASAASLIEEYMKDAGLDVWMDGMGNVHGRTKPEASEAAPALMLGSHFDTLTDGGIYDGPLGVLTAIAAAKALKLTRVDKGVKLPRPIEIVGFGDEEGTRFYSGMLGSKALIGTLGDTWTTLVDADGVSILDAMAEAGFDKGKAGAEAAKIDPSSVYGYAELHIEQGPVLEAMGLPVAAVKAIIGSQGMLVHIGGKQGHAGTSRMDLRKDALAGSAEMALFLENLCKNHPRVKEDMLVCTVGRMEVKPNVSNVITGDVTWTADIRCFSEEVLMEIHQKLRAEIAAICERRGLTYTIPVRFSFDFF